MTYNKAATRHIFFLKRDKTTMRGIQLSRAIDGFLLACEARRLSEHTITDYRRTLIRFLEHIGDCNVQDVTSNHVSAFLAGHKEFKAKTILNYHIGLSALWTWLIRENYTNHHVLRQVEKPRPQRIAVVPFTDVEVRAMLASVKRNEERDKSMIFLLLDTGVRSSELIGLSMKNIDLAARRIKVLGKGNKERLIPFSSRTASAIFRYTATLQSILPETLIYPYTRNSLADLVKSIGNRAGVKKAHPHRFRHTFAVTYLRNGGDPFSLQEILGHTTMEMVRVYLHLAQVDIDSAHKRASPVEGWKL